MPHPRVDGPTALLPLGWAGAWCRHADRVRRGGSADGRGPESRRSAGRWIGAGELIGEDRRRRGGPAREDEGGHGGHDRGRDPRIRAHGRSAVDPGVRVVVAIGGGHPGTGGQTRIARIMRRRTLRVVPAGVRMLCTGVQDPVRQRRRGGREAGGKSDEGGEKSKREHGASRAKYNHAVGEPEVLPPGGPVA